MDNASPVLDEVRQPQTVPDVPDYSEEEKEYLKGLQIKLERARNQRESAHDELDGMSYSQYWESNEKGANTFIEPKKNREDSTYQSGTIRRKIFAFLAELLKFEFYADVTAYDQNDIEVRDMGNAVEDAIAKSKEMENDDEKRMLRFYELFKQGDIFGEKEWDEQFEKQKQFKGAKFDGKVSGISIATKLKRKFGRVKTNILSGLNVFLGNIRIYDITDQPYIFAAKVMDYAEAEAKFGKWERWPYVAKTLKEFAPNRERSLLYNNWRLLDFQKGKVEWIMYQSKPDNEVALILNGVLMTPVGLPLSAAFGYDDYNITQQHLKPINAHFAYGSSIVKEMRTNVALLDDMKRIMHQLVLKSLVPARFNLTGKTISRRVFLPGAITAGIKPNDVPLADEKAVQGIGTSEFAFAKMLQDDIDANSINPLMMGQDPAQDPTATQVLTLSAQAKTMLGVVITACTLLEWKLAWLTLFTILAKWFDPTGDRVDEARKEIVKKYRTYGVTRPIENMGMGRRVTVPMDGELPTPQQVKDLEDNMEKQTGVPYRFTFLNPQEINNSKWIWQITVRSKPKANDEMSKMLFNKMVSDAVAMFGPDTNMQEFEAEYAVMWDRDPKKMFHQGTPAMNAPQPGQQKTVANGIKPPSPQDQMDKMMNSAVNPNQ